jgi:hypothetical protein
MTNITIAITMMAAYIIILCAIYKKIPNSLSQSVYMLPPYASWLWTAVIAGVAALIMPTMLDNTPEKWKFLAFFACAGLAITGLCPLSPKKDKTDLKYKAHMVGAWMSAVSSQALVMATHFWLVSLWLPWVVAFLWIAVGEKWPQKAFWAEITCIVSTFTMCLI